jgi:hypothetical protein
MRRGAVACAHGEAVHAIAVAEQRLEVVEMQPDAILASRDLSRVSAALNDGGDDDGVAGEAGLGRDDDTIADAEAGVGGEASVYCDSAWLILRDATRDSAWRVLCLTHAQ